MTSSDYGRRLALIAVAGLALLAVLYVAMGPNWFSFYGVATAALATAPWVAATLWRRLQQSGKSKWRALLYVVPAVALSGAQIGYWVMFFKTGAAGNATLGIVREMLKENVWPYLPVLTVMLLATWAWLFWSAAMDREPS